MLEQLRARLAEARLGALWVSRPENVRYLSGFRTPRDGRVLVTLDSAVLYTDARYAVQARDESLVPVFVARGQEVLDHAAATVRGLRIGFEADDPDNGAPGLTWSAHERLRSSWDGELVPITGAVESLRVVKTSGEVELMRRAARVADEAFADAVGLVVPGAAEWEVALALELGMRRRGASGTAFETIVASGPRGAMPHGVAGGRRIEDRDLVTIDYGALVDGYRSDATRTVAVGAPAERMLELYRVVREAQARAVEAVRPGATGREVDAAARDVISAAGYGEAFVHSTGHGVGLAIHENPRASQTSTWTLQPGMVLTVEPGVYLPGEGGVRIEDLVLVTETGHELLTGAPKAEL